MAQTPTHTTPIDPHALANTFTSVHDVRVAALGMEDGALAALTSDRYLSAINYWIFAARLWTLMGEPRLAKRALERAADARSALELEAAEQAQLDLEEGA